MKNVKKYKREFDVRINYMNHVQRNYLKFEMYKKAIQHLESRGVFKNILEQYPKKKQVKFERYPNRNAYNSHNLDILSNIFEPIMEQKAALPLFQNLFDNYTKTIYKFIVTSEKEGLGTREFFEGYIDYYFITFF